MRPALDFMGKRFADSRAGSSPNIIQVVAVRTSPAQQAIRKLVTLLRDKDSRFWLPLRGRDAWAPGPMHEMATLGIGVLGGIALRCVFHVDEFPWPLETLLVDATTDGERREVEAHLREMKTCCPPPSDGFFSELHIAI